MRYSWLLVVGATAGVSVAQPITLEALTLDQVGGTFGPGVEAGTVFTFFNLPSVDQSGAVIFHADVGGASLPPGATQGIWRFDTGSKVLAMRAQDPSPFNGAPLLFLGVEPHGGNGDVIGYTGEETLIYDGALSTLAHQTMIAPGLGPGVTFGFVQSPSTDQNGNYAFICDGDTGAVMTGPLGSLAPLAEGGMLAPGAGGDSYAGLYDVTMTEDGGIGVYGSLTTASVDAIFTGTAGGISVHVKEGDPAPDMPGGVTFDQVYSFALGDASGEIALKAMTDLTGGVTFDDNTGLWVGASGALALIARENDQAAGAPVGVLYGDQNDDSRPPMLTSAGQLALISSLKGASVDATNKWAVFAGHPGSFSMIARTGEVAPGTGGEDFTFFSSIAMSDSGHVVFEGSLSGGKWGLFSWHDSTGVVPIAVTGDIIDFGVWGAYPVHSMQFAGVFNTAPPGRAVGVNSDGVVAFKANLLIGNSGVVRAVLPIATDPADFNGDGTVDGADLAVLLASWGPCPAPCPPDLDGDGDVDGADLAALLAAWTP